jgi:Putative papain-like cysteine peptidase (DUF1796)
MDKYNHIISLGYVCNVTEYLNASGNRDKAYVFDRLATPMWAVNELITNGFENFLNHDNIKSDVLFDKSDKKYVYDAKYYIRLPLSHKQFDNRIEHFAEKIHERKDRFLQLLNEKNKILFIRDQEPTEYADLGNRKSYPEYEQKYQQTEIDYLRTLCIHLETTYPNLDFKILYLNENGSFVDPNNRIIGIPKCDVDYRDQFVGQKLAKHMKVYSDYLNTNL